MEFFAWVIFVLLIFTLIAQLLAKPMFRWVMGGIAKQAYKSMNKETEAYHKNYRSKYSGTKEKLKIDEDLDVIVPKTKPKKEEKPDFSNVEYVEFEDVD